MQIKPYLLPVFIAVSLAQGCSFSKSPASTSDSSASMASSPSSSEDEEELYQDEIMNYTSSYLRVHQYDHYSFSRGVTEIATANGITSWEQDETTFIAIGRGLKEARLPNNVYQTYKASIAGSNPAAMQKIQYGFDAQ